MEVTGGLAWGGFVAVVYRNSLGEHGVGRLEKMRPSECQTEKLGVPILGRRDPLSG